MGRIAIGILMLLSLSAGQERICLVLSRELSAIPARAPDHTVGDVIQVLRGADTAKCATIQTVGEQANIFLAIKWTAPSATIVDRAIELMRDSLDASRAVARAARKISIVDDLTVPERNRLKTRGPVLASDINTIAGKSLTLKDKGPK